MSGTSDEGGSPDGAHSEEAEAVETAVGAASSATSAASSAASDPVGAATTAASGALGVADAAGVEGASEAAAVVGAAAAVVSSAAELEHDPVGGLLGMAGGAASAVGATAAAQEGAAAVQQGAAIASSVAGLATTVVSAGTAVASAASSPPASAPAAAAAASDQAAWILGGTERADARFSFTTDSETGWRVRRMVLEERLDTPYECTIDLSHDDTTIDPLALLGQSATLTFERHAPRDVQGLIRRVERGAGGGSDRSMWARVTLVPALWTLGKNRNTRVFQEMSVPDILQELLEAGLSRFQREVQLDLQNTYAPREYCVQWEESDLDFCHRLMQEEGIWYHFDFSGDLEKMVLGDTASSFVGLETQDGQPVPYSPLSQGSGPIEAILELASARQLVPNKTVVREYDWTRPPTDILGEASITGEAAPSSDEAEMEEYLHGPSVTFADYAEPQFGSDDSAKQADLIARRRSTEIEVARARSELTLVSPGMTFDLSGHPVPELDRTWLVVAVRHEGSGAGEGGGEDAEEYTNQIELIPADVEWRPKRTVFKRRVQNVLSATVVGPAGEEIHTDVHGRIKVQFHWDRLGQRDDHSSCFVRSMQPWAGASWGMVFLPRIGMEVVVTFMDGDIDRPLVIGTVYNGVNPPPYALPDERTKSTIKTNSTPGGDGFNELRFEDAAGSEEVFIHAEKDMNEVVKNNHSRSVGANETISVGGNRTKSVDKNETITVTGSQKITITGGETGDGQTIQGGQLDITGKYQLDASDTINVQAPTSVRIDCGSSYFEMTPSQIKLHCGGATLILEAAQLEAKSSQASVMRLNADGKLVASGKAELYLTGEADLKNAAGSHINLRGGRATLESSSGGFAEMTANAAMEGQEATVTGATKATVAGATEATLNGSGGTVKASPAGVDADGPQVNINGSGMVNIAGAVVKLN